jgi:hypothetical protein
MIVAYYYLFFKSLVICFLEYIDLLTNSKKRSLLSLVKQNQICVFWSPNPNPLFQDVAFRCSRWCSWTSRPHHRQNPVGVAVHRRCFTLYVSAPLCRVVSLLFVMLFFLVFCLFGARCRSFVVAVWCFVRVRSSSTASVGLAVFGFMHHHLLPFGGGRF